MSSHGHSVQFYNDDTFLIDSVARFITEGRRLNETVVIISTAHHRAELQKALPPEQRTHEKLLFFDAREQLTKFMIDDWPNELRFKNVIGSIIGQASQHVPVRVFGEMVAVLWAEGRTRAAIRLEELWNRLIEKQSFSLLCAYPKSNFSEDNDSLLAISQLHTHVHTQTQPAAK